MTNIQFINEKRPIEEFLKHTESRKSTSHFQNRKVSMRQWHRFLRHHDAGVHDATTGAITKFADDLENDGYAPRSVRNKIYDISALYQFLIQYDLIDTNPVEDYDTDEHKDESEIHKRADRTHITPEEFEALLKAANNQRDRVLMGYMYSTGVRAVEACKTKLVNIDRDERQIEVETAKQDAYEERNVYYGLSFSRLLREWIDKDGREAFLGTTEDQGYLIPSHSNTRMHPSTVNSIVREAAWDADIQEKVWETQDGTPQHRVTSHSLRHSYAVNAVKEGLSIIFLRDALGHSDIEQTRGYLRYREDEKADELRKYRPSWKA
jgi:integrase/recombinase XerD